MPTKVFGMVSTKNSVDYTPYALRSFFEHTACSAEDDFILIDNDGSLDKEQLTEEFPQIIFVQHEQPHSFAENLNSAMRHAEGKKADLYFLNNDIIFAPHWIEPLDVDERALLIPVCNMQMNYQLGSFKCSLAMDLKDYIGCEKEFLEIVRTHRSTKRGYRLTHSVPYYCIKIPFRVYSEIGFFDESYRPAGWEDVDYTLRCYLRGIPLFFAMDSFILHFYGKSTWRAEGTLSQASAPEPGVEIFENKWGKDLAAIFGYHRGDALNYLKNLLSRKLRQ